MNKINNFTSEKLSNIFNIIKYPIISDKATSLFDHNKYTFIVDKRVNKFTIKKVLEYLFRVTILKINTLNVPKKKKNTIKFFTSKAKNKKAIITLKDGDHIKIFSDI